MTTKTAAKKTTARRPSIATASKPNHLAKFMAERAASAVVAKRSATGATLAEAASKLDFAGLAKEAVTKLKTTKMTRVSLALELIKAGKSNAEVQAALVEKFALPESHDYYARWYRAYAVQRGIITKEFAKAHSRGPVAPAPVEKMAPAAKPTPAKKAAKKSTRRAGKR